MPLPYIFAGLTTPLMSDLDSNFAALGALTPIPCLVSGTNALTFTPNGNTPTIPAYVNFQAFLGSSVATNTGAVTATITGLAALNVYKDTSSGPTALASGDIHVNNIVLLIYDSSLNSGAGGFHLMPHW